MLPACVKSLLAIGAVRPPSLSGGLELLTTFAYRTIPLGFPLRRDAGRYGCG